MKKSFLIPFFCLLSLTSVSAKDRVINNPVIDFNQSGITHITKIVLTDTETRVYVLDKFIPGWWVRYDRTDYLLDNVTGKRYQIQDIIGGELDKEMYMNNKGSGDSARVLIFPPIDKTVKKVDLIGKKDKEVIPMIIPNATVISDTTVLNSENAVISTITTTVSDNDGGGYNIYGISLNPKDKPKPKTVPAEVQKWLAGEISKAKRKTLLDIDGGEFFVKDTARIVGYIKGYDRRAEFSKGNIFGTGYITCNTNVTVHEDGRFEGDFMPGYPRYITIFLGKATINFYIEPGQTLSMILDWEEFRKADRKRNIKYIFTDIKFDGATAGINSEMCGFFAKLPDDNIKNDTRFQDLLKSENLQSRTKRLLQIYRSLNQVLLSESFPDSELPPDFPKNDLLLMGFNRIIEIVFRLENNRHITDILSKATQPVKSLKEYIHDELGLKQTVQDSLFYALFDSLSKNRNAKYSRKQMEEFTEIFKNYNEKYQEQFNEYHKKYTRPLAEEFNRNKRPQIEDSIFTNVLKVKPGLLYDLVRIEKYKQILYIRPFTAGEKEEITRSFAGNIQPLAQSLIDRNTEIEKMTASVTFETKVIVNENPAVENEKLMATIMEKYRGKVVFVNFWNSWNDNACLDEIKTISPVKEELQAKDVVFLYITGEISSVFDWLQKVPEIHGEHYRLTNEQWNFLYNKLGIKNIPAYLIYDKNGSIASELYTGYPGNETVKNAIEKELSK